MFQPRTTSGAIGATVAELRRALKLVVATATNKSADAAHHRIDVKNDGAELVFEAADAQVWARSALRIRGIGSLQGSLPPLPLLRALPTAGHVEVEADTGCLCLGGVRFTLEESGGLTPPVNEAPVTNLVSVNRDDLARIAPAICRDETRFTLDGVLVESVSDRQRLVATDGHRLSVLDSLQPFQGASIRLPRRVVELVLKSGAPVAHIAVAGKWLHIEMHEFGSLRCQVADSEFPDYRIVLPKKEAGHVSLERRRLLDALVRLQKTAHGRGIGVKFVPVAGGTAVEVIGGDALTTFTQTLPVAGPCKNLEAVAGGFGLNPAYVVEQLKVLGSAVVELGFKSALDPISIRGVEDQDRNHTYIVMPVRL